MVYFYFDSYTNEIILGYYFYTILILFYPILKFFLKCHNMVWLFVFLLAYILWHYWLEAFSIVFHSSAFFLDFFSFTLFDNVVDFNLSFVLSPASYFFSLLVLMIGFSTNIYLLNYFKGEADESGFVFWINAFIISMLILILSNNFFSLFLGWELIGLTSFFLINFWQNKRSTLKSSFKAFSFNLISDLFLLGAFVIFYQLTLTSDISAFLYIVTWESHSDVILLKFGTILLLGCASIKSVQIIGHLWLPDSMEAPVPASALIHSATLVSAGIYLLLRFNQLILFLNWSSVLVVLGGLTASYGGVVAASQTDMKKLLAYSTMSHCGFLMILVASANFYILITYLFLHGLFKAVTFFCAGSFIRIYGSQDTRLMGSTSQLFLAEIVLLIISAGNLAGLPLTIGVLYKNCFLTLLFMYNFSLFCVGLLFLGMLTGLLYFYRLVYYACFDFSKWTNLSSYEILEVVFVKFRKSKFFLNKTHLLATLSIFLFSFVVFFAISWMINSSVIEYEVGVFTNFLPSYLFKVITHVYLNHFVYFYFAYFVLFLVLLFLTWRYQIVWGYKFETIMFSVNFVLIFSFFVVVF